MGFAKLRNRDEDNVQFFIFAPDLKTNIFYELFCDKIDRFRACDSPDNYYSLVLFIM
jgi:hypothetical protein